MTMPIDTHIFSLIKNGRWREAKKRCLCLCQSDPANAEAWFLLAGIHSQLGDYSEVAGCCSKVAALQPLNPSGHYNLGVALQKLGRLDEAKAAYYRVLHVAPRNAPALANLGLVLYEQKQYREAADYCRQALVVDPTLAEVRNTLGLILKAQGRIQEAMHILQQVLQSKPDLAQAHYNLGLCHIQQKNYTAAVECFQSALRHYPEYADARNDLGIALRELGRIDEALIAHRRAIEINPEFSAAYNNIGTALIVAGDPSGAVASFRSALQINPDYAEAYSNLGNALVFSGKYDEALSSYERALQINLDYADAHWNRSWVLLLKGDFEQGWREYEWRWQCGVSIPRLFSKPLWDGGPLNGKHILLHAEQGAGDTIQFIRYASLVKQRGGKVLVECQPELIQLFAGCVGIDILIEAGGPLPDFDCHAPIPSLPGIFNTSLDSMPANVPYIHPPETADRDLNRLLADSVEKFRVGIAWSGNAHFKFNRYRSCRLSDFEPIVRLPGISLFSLQKGGPASELTEGKCSIPITDLSKSIHNFADTASAINQLDLVITVDTSVAHLAGALGKPVWLLLSFAPDWRWLLERMDSPWYPTMRLFRQSRLDDWKNVFASVADSLAALLMANQTLL